MGAESKLDRFIAAAKAGVPRALELLDLFEPAIDQQTLDIDGQEPLRFKGHLVRQGSTEFINSKPGDPNHDFWTVKVYRTSGANGWQYAVAFSYTTTIKKQHQTTCFAGYTDNPAETIQAYNPLEHLRGYPDAERFAKQQTRLELTVKAHYAKLVSILLHDPFEV